jgi:hypothetical protein
MAQSPSPRQVVEMEKILKLAQLEEKNKEAARIQLLRIQALVSRTHPTRKID